MNKRKIWLVLVFILGIAAGICISGAARGKGSGAQAAVSQTDIMEHGKRENIAVESETQDNEAAAHEVPETRIPGSETPFSTCVSGTAYPQWSKEETYVGGDKAVYQGKIYKAKWWTLGEIPGQADVWEDTLETSQQPGTDISDLELPDASESHRAVSKPMPDVISGLKVVGYYPDWKGYQKQKLQFDVLTHVVYAFAIPTPEGGLRPLEHPETASRLIADAHDNHVKVLLAVGGWSYNGMELEPVFVSATSSGNRIEQFGDQILSMCEQYGFDGVDIDWEHPRVDGTSSRQYQELMLYLAEKLHAQGKVLTSAVISGVSADGNIYYDAAAHSDQVLNAVDWIHVMAYDGGDGERHSSYEFAVNCAQYWSQVRKVPKEKVILGVPFYGRPGWAGYEDILAADPLAWSKDHATVNGIDAYYNGISTIEKKTAYAKENLGGIMIWELTQDTPDHEKSLLTAIGKKLRD